MRDLPESTRRRLDALVNRDNYHADAEYYAMAYTFRNWLLVAQISMQDEGVEPHVIERVLNRMVFGHPVPSRLPRSTAVQRGMD